MGNHLKTLIIQQIKEVFGDVKVYDEPVKQGLQTPAFLVLFYNQHQQRLLGKQSVKTNSVTISYFPENEDVRWECDEVLETFQNEFRYSQSQYHVHELEGEVVDDVLVITFAVKGYVSETIEETKMHVLGGVRIV